MAQLTKMQQAPTFAMEQATTVKPVQTEHPWDPLFCSE
jgi:hypothetical protein